MNHSFRHLRTRLLVAGISLAAFAGTNGASAAEAGRVLFTSTFGGNLIARRIARAGLVGADG